MGAGRRKELCVSKKDFFVYGWKKRFVIAHDKFVGTTMQLFNAILFSILFSFYGCYLFPLNCTMYHWPPIDFTWFCSTFGDFYKVVTDLRMDG